MKRLILYYSLTGHTRAAAEQLAAQTAATLCEIRTVKPMPTSRFSQIMYGGMLSSGFVLSWRMNRRRRRILTKSF